MASDSWPDSGRSELDRQAGTIDSRSGAKADLQKFTRTGDIQNASMSGNSPNLWVLPLLTTCGVCRNSCTCIDFRECRAKKGCKPFSDEFHVQFVPQHPDVSAVLAIYIKLGRKMPSKAVYQLRTAMFLISIAFFISSLLLVPIQTTANKEPVIGFAFFMWGWLGPLDGVFAWYANPFLGLAWVNFLGGKISLAVRKGIWSTLLIATFLLHKSILLDEGGGRAQIVTYKLGYWLWLLSPISLLLACSLANKIRALRDQDNPQTQDNAA